MSTADGELADVLALLRAQYRATLADKVAQLAALTIRAAADSAAADDLKRAYHKLAGSAGSYGFARVSAVSRAHELRIAPALTSNVFAGAFGSDTTRLLLHHFRAAVIADDGPAALAELPPLPRPPALDLLVVSPAGETVSSALAWADAVGITAVGDGDLDTLQALVESAELQPRLLLLGSAADGAAGAAWQGLAADAAGPATHTMIVGDDTEAGPITDALLAATWQAAAD
jgi:hypothetical protein